MTQKIKITADSTCDLPKYLQDKYDITLVPLHVSLGNNSYLDGIDVSCEKLFSYVDRTGELPKTSAPSLADYDTIFKKYSDEGYEIIHLSLSSKISSAYNNACFVAKKYPSIHVIDTKNICGSSAIIAVKAAELIQQGCTISDILKNINNNIANANTSFIPDTLIYLHKGGRCSSTAVLANAVLDIKPCIEMHDGEMSIGKKYRQMSKKVIHQYIDDMLKNKTTENDIIYVANTFYETELIDYAVEVLKTEYKFKTLIIGKAGSIISTHCGPNTIGLFFI